jgi:AcrR family transcriptional regulator
VDAVDSATGRLGGRKAEAARNDRVILDAARDVFVREPNAPISDVAEQAGVGIGALYRRYAGKEELLRTLCADGLHRFIAIAEAALAGDGDPWEAFAGFVRGIIDSDVHSLTVHLAGTFSPTAELHGLAAQAGALADRVFRRAKAAGVLRGDLRANDVQMIFEQVTAIRVGDAGRTAALRRRYLALQLDALRAGTGTARLPGSPPTAEELGRRWRPQAVRTGGRASVGSAGSAGSAAEASEPST